MCRKSWLITAAVMLLGQGVLAQELKSSFYGYLEGYVEKSDDQRLRSGGNATTPGTAANEKQPAEFNTPNINVMMKSTFQQKHSGYLNLSGQDGENVTVRNAWVESKLLGEDHLKVRMGKLYRPFGLYNEILDAVPTYMGIEPPELFDKDHLLLTRTTNLMFHGQQSFSGSILRYALTTGNDERFSDELPVGGDLRYSFFGSDFDVTVGTSFYTSGGKAKPSKGMGEGSPDGGVINWMESDKFNVLGLYTEVNSGSLKVQAAYYNAAHDAVRDGTRVQSLATDGGLNQRQIDRICGGNCSTATNSTVDYDVQTWYIRAGYSFVTDMGEILPYVQYDYYSNPETIQNKDNGGDKEAGVTDDGKFAKQTLGVVYRPYPVTAIKLDYSNHEQKIDGKNEPYGEVRFSYSYIWTL